MKTHRAIAAALVLWLGASDGALAADPKVVQFFKETCGICHGDNGEGIASLAPALKGNAFVTAGDMKALEETIAKGRQGDQKKYKELASPMPPNSISGKKLQALIAFLQTDLQQEQ